MRYLAIPIISFIILCPAAGFSKTIIVPDDYPTIQQAMDQAANGDTVLVEPGTYVENIDFLGMAITVKSVQGPEDTIIDGSQAWSTVTFKNGETAASVLDGFTLRNGCNLYGGGGIHCLGTAPTITNNIILQNKSITGGGIYCNDSSPAITKNIITLNLATGLAGFGGGICCTDCDGIIIANNTISSNETEQGGGIYCTACNSVMISGNNILKNRSTIKGGGILCIKSDATLRNNIITRNTAREWCGGGICFYGGASSLITNNLITENTADFAGGIAFLEYADLIAVNNTFTSNKAASKGGAVYCDSFSSPTLANSILWNNTAPLWPEIFALGNPSVTYCDIQDGHPGTGNIDSDPLFVDSANSDYHLTFNSPCRNSGDNASVTEIHDFEDDPRISYGTADMGADEFYTHLYWTGEATPNGNVALKFVGLPGTAPVGLCVGSGVLDPPIPSMWGDWHLQFPIIGPINLKSIPSPGGVLIIPGAIPGTPPPPYSIPMQALIGAELTNLCLLEVK